MKEELRQVAQLYFRGLYSFSDAVWAVKDILGTDHETTVEELRGYLNK